MSKRRARTAAQDAETAAVVKDIIEAAERDEAFRREIAPLLEEYALTCREERRLEWYSPWRILFLALGLLFLVALVASVWPG